MMRIGCMMHNFPQASLEEVCRTIKEIGAEAIEACALKGGYPYVDLDGDPVEQRKVIDSYGLEVSGLSVHCEMIKDPDSVPYLKKAIRWAASASIPCLITGEGWKSEGMDEETAFEIAQRRILEVLKEAERFKVAFAMEPHGTFSLTIEGLKRLMGISQSEYYIINFDVGNIMRFPEEDSAQLLREVVGRVGHVHIKDKRFLEGGGAKTVPIGTGDVNIAGCVEVLKEAGYTGVLSVEVLGVPDPLEESRMGIEYLKRLIPPP
jgi:inosose dehydratase